MTDVAAPMDALSYFLFHSLVYNLVLGAAFALLGVLLGYFIWGVQQRRAEAAELKLQFTQTQLTKLKQEVDPLRTAAESAQAKLATTDAVRAELQGRLDALGSRVARLDLDSQAGHRQLAEARAGAESANARADRLAAELRALQQELEKTPTVALDDPPAAGGVKAG